MSDPTENKRRRLRDFILRSAGVETKILNDKNLWENVTGHCLMEAARACIFADLLGFDAELKKDLALAALLHDGHKKREIEAIKRELSDGGSGYAASNAVTKKYLEELRRSGVPERTVRLIGFTGGMPDVLLAVKKIIDEESFRDEELASLAAYYIDAYTRGEGWAEPAGDSENDLDRRVQKNKENPAYTKINIEAAKILQSDPFFSGMDPLGAMAVLGHDIEKMVAEVIKKKNGTAIKPEMIPETVDAEIKKAVR